MKHYGFDLDGTLRATKSGKPCPNTPGDQFLLPNVKKKLIELRSETDNLYIISNQGGVSWGFMSEYDAWKITEYFVKLTGLLEGFEFVDIKLCFFHPQGKYSDRYSGLSSF